MIKLIIFDLWETLCDKKYRKGNTKDLCKELGKKYSYRKILKVYEKYFQLDWSLDFEKKYEKVFKELKVPYNKKLIKKYASYRRKIDSHFITYDYAIPLLKLLKQKGYKIAVLSNSTKLAGSKIIKFKISKYIDKFFFSYDLKSIKPNPKNFKAALSYFKVKPSEALMVGNTYEDDVLAPRKLGIKAIHFKNGRQLKRDLKKMGVL